MMSPNSDFFIMLTKIFNVFFPNTNPGQFKILRRLKQIIMFGELRHVDPNHVAIFKRYIKKGDVVIEVGANNGDYVAKYLKRGAFVYAFEPSTMFRTLFERYQFHKRVKCFSVALGREEGELWLNEFSGDGISTTVIDWLSGYGKSIMTHKVYVKKLDQFNLGPDFIKIDAEGMDFDILIGAEETIKKYRPIVMTECNAFRLKDAGHNPQNIVNFMSILGYRCEEIWSHPTIGDFLFIPNER